MFRLPYLRVLRLFSATFAVVAFGLVLPPARAATVTWTNAVGTNDWFDTNNWSSLSIPTTGDVVVITNSGIGVLLTNSTYPLGSLLISNTATLVFSNWATVLNATTVTVEKSAILTHWANGDSDGSDGWAPDARVWISCSNLTVAVSGSINVNLKGYGARTSAGPGYGPGGGRNETNFSSSGYTNFGQGAGYGGFGAGAGSGTVPYILPYGSLPYGTLTAPEDPGSGGGSSSAGSGYSGVGSWGGGAIKVDASGQVSINGTLSANGGSVSTNWRAGAGSGGAIFITCDTLAGSNGLLSAVGGVGYGASYVASGGGGRIAVLYNSSAQASLPKPTLRFDTSPGYSGTATARLADIGTVYFTNSLLLSNVLTGVYGQLRGFPAWSVDRLMVTNCWIRFAEEGFTLTVTQDLVVATNAKVQLGGSQYVYLYTNRGINTVHLYFSLPTPCNTGSVSSINVGGNLRLTNNAQLTLYNAPTGTATETYGALLTVTGQLWIAAGSWLYPQSHPTNGGSALMVLGFLRTDSGGGINANALGLGIGPYNTGSRGPGGGLSLAGTNCGGAGYGGAGGGWTNAGGITYGNSNAPIDPGSKGANWVNGTAGVGGGLIRLQVNDSVQHDGTFTANAGAPYDQSGGSGGGIYLRCRSLSGTGGTFQAKGSAGAAAATYHGGGGGRIAVWRMYHTFTGTNVTVAGGAAGGAQGRAGTNGTIVWGQIPVPGTIFTGK